MTPVDATPETHADETSPGTPAGPLAATAMPATTSAADAVPSPAPRERNVSLDFLRGWVMVLMALDHARDFWSGFGEPTNLETTTPALFMTRWVTHFCAPSFVFLAGISAYLYGVGRTPGARSRFLWTRGLWLIVLELSIIRFAWIPRLAFQFFVFQVIWAIGFSMVALAGISRLPRTVLVPLGVLLVAGHNLVAGVDASDLGALGWLWTLAFEPGQLSLPGGRGLFVAYPALPWLGVMTLGFALGPIMQRPLEIRRRFTLRLGVVLTLGFVLLRATNVYGDPAPWTVQGDPIMTALSFLNCEKYPPSLCYLLMTLGPALMLLGALEHPAIARVPGALNRFFSAPVVVLGRVPLFYYVAHLYLLRAGAALAAYLRFGADGLAPPPAGHGFTPEVALWATYVAWFAALLLLYPASRWFAGVKRRHRVWWMSYL